MFKKAKIQIKNTISENDKILLETEVDVLKGVKDIIVNEKNGEVVIEFDDELIALDKILNLIEKFGFRSEERKILPVQQEHTYFVKGMHCASCEVLIEKKLSGLKEIESVEASADKGRVFVVYQGEKPGIDKLNKLFRAENYLFFDHPSEVLNGEQKNDFLFIAGVALLIIIGFLLIKNSSLAGLISVNSNSSLPMFFFLGLLAGVSSCAALVGGLVLSMSKQWLNLYSEKKSTLEKLQPHLMFNIGRLVSYVVLGGIIGAVGSKFKISLTFTSVLIVAVSVMMFFLAFQMFGFKAFRKFQFTMPKFITRRIADETKFQGKQMPFLMGALTFFLPCGFTITAQGLALISGSAMQGALIMLFFALGTSPALLAIGLSSIKFSQKPHLANKFLRVAGILILFFALFNINAQLNVLGFPSFSDIKFNSSNRSSVNNNEEGLPSIVGGKQILKMDALAYGYSPNYMKVKAGIPVRWEITDKGTSGCTNAVISRGLFSGEIALTQGQTIVKEFTPTKAGKYKFSCWMGMVSGIIEVVDSNAAAKNSGGYVQAANIADVNDEDVIPSGAQGCGCGGGSGGSCGAR